MIGEWHYDLSKRERREMADIQAVGRVRFAHGSRLYCLFANRQMLEQREMTGEDAKRLNLELLAAFQASIGPDGKGTIPLARWCVAR